MSINDTPKARSQAEWWKLARKIESVIYADNKTTGYGAPVDEAAETWIRKKHPAGMRTRQGIADALSIEVTRKRYLVTDACAHEAMKVLKRWRDEETS